MHALTHVQMNIYAAIFASEHLTHKYTKFAFSDFSFTANFVHTFVVIMIYA